MYSVRHGKYQINYLLLSDVQRYTVSAYIQLAVILAGLSRPEAVELKQGG